MKINLDKNKFAAIEGAFLVLKEDSTSKAALDIIAKNLKECFGCTFNISVINDNVGTDKSMFVMSVFPELSTVDKIINAVLQNKDTDAIRSLWQKNDLWNIEIDELLLKSEYITCNEKELTAILLHEVGHIISSTSIPSRVSLILRYELAKTSAANKMLLKNKIFSNIMSLPVLDACISDIKRDKKSIKDEIKADAFVKKMGYEKELTSVLTKLSQNKYYPNNGTIDEKMKKVTDFSLETIDSFQKRKEKLMKPSLLSLKESCRSPYINSVIDEYMECTYDDNVKGLTLSNGEKIIKMHQYAEMIIQEGYYTEFFIFGKKDLKKIDPSEIDYIDVKINSIKNENDKMMIISYIHSKLDLIEYYISILNNPKYSKKYNIPHTLSQLYAFRDRLNNLREITLKYRIPERNKGILVSWAPGYEG